MLILTFLGACTEESMQIGALGSGTWKTPEERALEAEARNLNQVSRNIIVKNTLEGAAVGALAGCGLALLLGGDGGDCAAGAAAGAVVGGVGGHAVGAKTAKKNEEIVRTKEVVANLSQVSTRLNSVEAKLRNVLSSQSAEIRSLKRQLQAGQVSESAYKTRVRAINSNRSAVQASLAKSEQNMVNAKGQIAQARSQGQPGLAQASQAAESNRRRLARTRATIKAID
ncbi:hypothetical protein [Leisingera sp. S232]|uniref:hypothetical protein n=1 Tax=Leisingera sp. S232 TaxID=3415132 RepID=UPI003C7CC9AA